MSCKESQWNTKWVVTGLFFQVCTKHNPAHQQHHRASVQPLPCYNHWLDSLNIFLFNLISFSAHNKHGELGRENKWEFVWCNRQAEAIGERSGSDYLYKRWVVSCEWMSHENFKHFSTLSICRPTPSTHDVFIFPKPPRHLDKEHIIQVKNLHFIASNDVAHSKDSRIFSTQAHLMIHRLRRRFSTVQVSREVHYLHWKNK